MAIIDRGEILLEAEPLAAVAALRGRIWRARRVAKHELPALEREHAVICTKLQAGAPSCTCTPTRAGAGVRAGRAGPGGRLLQRHGRPPLRARALRDAVPADARDQREQPVPQRARGGHAASTILGGLGMLVTAGIFGDAASRDVQTRMHSLFYTSPLREAHYLGGRFLGALLVNASS
jgi:hypothetical protein